MSGPPHVHWIDPRRGHGEALAVGLEHLQERGGGVLRGRGTSARRVLAKVAAALPDGVEAFRIPEPSDSSVTTLIIYRPSDGPPPAFSGGGITQPSAES